MATCQTTDPNRNVHLPMCTRTLIYRGNYFLSQCAQDSHSSPMMELIYSGKSSPICATEHWYTTEHLSTAEHWFTAWNEARNLFPSQCMIAPNFQEMKYMFLKYTLPVCQRHRLKNMLSMQIPSWTDHKWTALPTPTGQLTYVAGFHCDTQWGFLFYTIFMLAGRVTCCWISLWHPVFVFLHHHYACWPSDMLLDFIVTPSGVFFFTPSLCLLAEWHVAGFHCDT